MLFALMCPLAVAFKPEMNLDVAVSYHERAKSVAVVLKDLSKAAHVQLSANSEAAREVVLVSAEGLPLRVLMDKIAFVTSCKWDQVGDAYTLKPDVSLRNREETREIEQRIARIQKGIQKMLARAQKPPVPRSGTDARVILSRTARSVGVIAIAKILSEIDPAQLASLPEDGRQVWATNEPTQMQMPLPSDVGQIISDWVTDRNAAVSKLAAPPVSSEPAEQLPPEVVAQMKARREPVTTPIAKAILVATTDDTHQLFQLRLTAYSAEGKVFLSANLALDASEKSALIPGQAAQKSSAAVQSTKTAIEYSPESKEFRTMSLKGLGQTMGPEVSASLRAKLMNPEDYEPLGFMATDNLLAVAKARHRQLVVDIPDSEFSSPTDEDPDSNHDTDTVETETARIASGSPFQGVDEGGVLALKPARPAESRLNRADRQSLVALLATAAAKKLVYLDDIADYSLANQNPSFNPITTAYFTIFFPEWMDLSLDIDDFEWSGLRVFGSMDTAHRQSLRSGGPVSFSDLNPTERLHVSTYVFGPAFVIRDDVESGTEPPYSLIQMGQDYRSEGTELMAHGLPAAGSISCSLSTEPIAVIGGSDGLVPGVDVGPLELARMILESKKSATEARRMPSSARLGSRNKLDFKFRIAPKLCGTASLLDPSLDPTAQKIDLNALPASFAALVAKEIEDINTDNQLESEGAAGKQATPPR